MPAAIHHKYRRCVLVFARAPVLGRVKTRLAAGLPEPQVLRLYRCMVEDTVDMLRSVDADIVVQFHPHNAGETMRSWLGPLAAYRPQQGRSLGERMAGAFRQAFDCGADHALCIGTDIPTVHPGIIAEAFAQLQHRRAVLGPTVDGGYYLIGLTGPRLPPNIFAEDIPWGSGAVCAATSARLSAAGLSIHRLPTLRDIDTIDDLIDFHHRAREGGRQARRTTGLMKTIAPTLAGDRRPPPE